MLFYFETNCLLEIEQLLMFVFVAQYLSCFTNLTLSVRGSALDSKSLNICNNGRRPLIYRYSNEMERANEDIYDDL